MPCAPPPGETSLNPFPLSGLRLGGPREPALRRLAPCRERPHGLPHADVPGPRVKYPEWVAKVPEEKSQYLIDLKVENDPRPDWVPKGKPWGELNEDTKLLTSKCDAGQVYKKTLYAHAETEIVYALPEGYTHFVAAAGFGEAVVPRGSVVFRVFVDGKEKYRSDACRPGTLLPVVVDIEGAKKLELVTEDAGIYHDYVWWGEARLVKE